MVVATSVAIGVLSSLAASLVFWYGILRLRPTLEISPQIARTETDNGNPEHRYRIKIINPTRRAAVDVRVFVYLEHKRKVAGGDIRVQKNLTPIITDGSIMPARKKIRQGGLRKIDDPDSPNTRRIRIREDLHSEWKREQQHEIVVRIYARDGISGYIREFEQRYRLHSDICDGSFEFGPSLEILPA